MEITEECTGLASLGDCRNAAVACTRAYELFEAAKLPVDDKYRRAVSDADVACEKKAKRESNVPVQ